MIGRFCVTSSKQALVFFCGFLFIVVALAARSLLWEFSLFKSQEKQRMTLTPVSPLIVQKVECSQERLPQKLMTVYDNVETFVMFIGHPRSGHSLVAAILDAHPEIIIPHEYDIMKHWNEFKTEKVKKFGVQKHYLFYRLHELSAFQAMFDKRAETPVAMDGIYSYNISGGWQGTYRAGIKVIGDKKGGSTSNALRDPANFTILDEIRETVGIPLKFVHVIRNPFDSIASCVHMGEMFHQKEDDENTMTSQSKKLDIAIEKHFGRAEANKRVKELYGDAVLEIFSHEMILYPSETLTKLCSFLEVICYDAYISVVEKAIQGKPSITRNTVTWTKEQIDRVEKEMKKYYFLKQFSFHSKY